MDKEEIEDIVEETAEQVAEEIAEVPDTEQIAEEVAEILTEQEEEKTWQAKIENSITEVAASVLTLASLMESQMNLLNELKSSNSQQNQNAEENPVQEIMEEIPPAPEPLTVEPKVKKRWL